MRLIETIPGTVREGIRENGAGVNSSMIYLIHCKNFYKCHKILPPSTIIKNFQKSVANKQFLGQCV
jgi:hypothetical protein